MNDRRPLTLMLFTAGGRTGTVKAHSGSSFLNLMSMLVGNGGEKSRGSFSITVFVEFTISVLFSDSVVFELKIFNLVYSAEKLISTK